MCGFGGQSKVLKYNEDKKTNNDRTVQARCASHLNQGYDKPRAEEGLRIRGFADGEVKEGERAFMCSNRVAADSSSWDGCDLSLLGEGRVREGRRAECDCSREPDLCRDSVVAGGEGSWSRLGNESKLV